jgi:hypothetical protein
MTIESFIRTPFSRDINECPVFFKGFNRLRLETFLTSELGIHHDRLPPIQQYPSICRSKRSCGRKEEENPHPSQKSEGLRHPKIQPTPKHGPPANHL